MIRGDWLADYIGQDILRFFCKCGGMRQMLRCTVEHRPATGNRQLMRL